MKVLLIVNPMASSVTPRAEVVIRRILASDHDVDLAHTVRRGHATRLAATSIAKGTEVVVVFGGDGTVNEVANGLVDSDTALACLPGGSTNVFSRTLGIPDDPVDGAEVLLNAIHGNRIPRIGVGDVNGRVFLFHVGVGFDAAVVEQVERRGELKRWLSHPLFALAAVDTWFRGSQRWRHSFTVDFDVGDPVVDGRFAVVLNSNPYTYLGSRPFDIAPEATLDRALVAVTVTDMHARTIVGMAATALRGRTSLADHPAVDYRTDLDALTITADVGLPHQVDGDFLGRVSELRFRHRPAALRLVHPDAAPVI